MKCPQIAYLGPARDRRRATAAALATAGAGEALAAPQFQTLTVGNGGKNLAVQNGQRSPSRRTRATPPSSSSCCPGQRGSSEPGFGPAFQRKNRPPEVPAGHRNGSQLVEQNCSPTRASTPPSCGSSTPPDREVTGSVLPPVQRKTDRVISQAPQFGNAVPVVASPAASNTGSAAAALQLWNLARVN